MTESEVSIIVPIYNVEKYLPKCIESLTVQTWKNIKIWLISDGSPDNSANIAKTYAGKDSRIIVIEKENGGYGSVLESAIEKINSEYFLICDPDDWLRPDCVEMLIKAAKKESADIVIGNRYDVYINETEKIVERDVTYGRLLSNVVYTGANASIAAFCDVSPHAKLYRTEICKEIRMDHKVSFTDFTLFLAALNRAERVMHLPVPLAYYLCDRPGNTNTAKDVKKIYQNIRVWQTTKLQLDVSDDALMYKLFTSAYMIFRDYVSCNEHDWKLMLTLSKLFTDEAFNTQKFKPYTRTCSEKLRAVLLTKKAACMPSLMLLYAWLYIDMFAIRKDNEDDKIK